MPIKQGLDLAGGTRVVLEAKTVIDSKGVEVIPDSGDKPWNSQEYLPAIVRILRQRIDIEGVSEPLIQPKGDKQIIVELPSIKNREQAIADLQSTAQMQFIHLHVQTNRNPSARFKMDKPHVNDKGDEVYTFTDADGKVVSTDEVLKSSDIVLTGADIRPNAVVSKNQQTFGNVIELQFTDEGAKKFADFTRRNVDEYLAIVLDGKILSAPTIKTAILDGKAIIEGQFTTAEAQRLAEFINAGALPVPLTVVQSTTVDATLGHSSVHQSVLAGIIGLLLVVGFMVSYYLLPGLVADIALVIYALLTMAVFKAIPVTLTLPGIAAYILSIGMAVDANILIFERLKEELRSGKTLRAAIDAGFSRAFTSIFDSNMCTLITSAILWYYGTGPIKGFALVLGIGVLLSMFTAITASRAMLYALVNTGVATHPAMFGLKRQWVIGQSGRQMDIVGKWKIWFTLSGLILVPGIFFLCTGGLKPGIDFTGGSLMQVKFTQPVQTTQVETAMANAGLSGSTAQKSTSDPTEIFIRTKFIDPAKEQQVTAELTKSVGQFRLESLEKVGPSISKELTSNAFWAVILASLVIILYLSVRFAIGGLAQGFRFGVCAIAATLHDVFVILGIFAILGHFLHWEIDSLFVTAVLTIIGFSTHDTIVIFDRIRENLKHKTRGDSFDDLVNKSILQSFARSINTSFTVFLTLLMLLLFGAQNIHHFVAALLIGVVSGTYSSIFNASILLNLWQKVIGAPVGAQAPVRPRETRMAPVSSTIIPNVEEEVDDAAADSEAVGSAPAAASAPKSRVMRKKRRY
jgi:SecD/SecF fusion protein